MSREVVFGMWVSQIPEKMYQSWVSKGYIMPGSREFEPGKENGWNFVFDIKQKRVNTNSLSEKRRYEAMGGRLIYSRFIVKDKEYEKMQKEVGKWYDEVFDYVTKWLERNNLIHLKKGSFNGGFCAVSTEDETTKGWGAPLAEKKNKIIQIKEKFGRIVVYTHSLTKEEREKLDKFAIHCEEKFDCTPDFC